MIFKEIGDKNLPAIVLLHGGGLSDWSWGKVADRLKPGFHLVIPVIDGHGKEAPTDFVSIEDSADKLLHYIDRHHNGQVYAIGGLSLGAQIAVEVLSRRRDIAQYAIIESALLYPTRGMARLAAFLSGLLYGLIRRRRFAKLQAKALCIPEELFASYYNDSREITRQSLQNIALSNGNYRLKSAVSDTTARVLIMVGARETGIMKKSACLLHGKIKDSRLFVAPGMRHGELSLVHTKQYIEQVKALFAGKTPGT